MKHLAWKWCWRGCVLAVLAALASGGAPAGGGQSETWEQASRQLALDLDSLARWCQEQRLFGRRDQAYEVLIQLDPEHGEARRFLKHERQRDGSWKVKSPARACKDYGAEHWAEYEVRRVAAVARFREPLLALVDGSRARTDEALRERIWTTLLLLDSEDERARSERGEVKDARSGGWVLRETAAAAEREAELQRALAAALEAIGAPSRSEPTAAEEELGPRWATAYATEHVRVLGTGEESSIEECARQAEAALRLFAVACATDARLPSDYTIYLFATAKDQEEFLRAHPLIGAARSQEARGHSSYWIPGTTELAIWPTTPELRLDHVVRQSIACMVVRHYAIGPEEGWAFEGLGIYLTEAIAGRSLTNYGQGSRYRAASEQAPVLKSSAGDSSASENAGALFAGGGERRLEYILRKNADTMGNEDRRVSVALCRYLIEGRPEDVDHALTLAGRDRPGAEALERALGLDLPQLEARLERFLREVADGAAARVEK